MSENNPKPGATGKYPDGKLSPSDQGELRFTVEIVKNRILIEYGKAVEWLTLDKKTAIKLRDTLHNFICQLDDK